MKKQYKQFGNIAILAIFVLLVIVCNSEEDQNEIVTLTGISVINVPLKTSYFVGETLELSGLEIIAFYSDGSSKTITDYTTNPVNSAVLNNPGTTTIQVNYIENGVTKSTDFVVIVNVISATAGITINIGQVIDGTPLPFGSIRISRSGVGFPVTENISVNPSDYDSGSIRWEIAGAGHFSDETIIGSGSSFTLNAADVRYNSLGGHTLTLSVRKNGLQYQREIPFTIMQ